MNITELIARLKTAAQEEMMCREAGDTSDLWQDEDSPESVLALVEALESAQRTIAELESDKRLLRPVGVMSESRFRALENRESRFIALWPRPGIYLPRKRPDDGVIVYASTGIKCELKGE